MSENLDFNQKKLIKRFVKKFESNLINYIPLSGTVTKQKNGFVIILKNFIGIKKTFDQGARPLDKNFFVSINCTFYSSQQKRFFGNYYMSKMISISFDENNMITAMEDSKNLPIKIYFFSDESEGNKLIIELVYITTSLNDIVEKQEVLGWGIVNDPTNTVSDSSINLYMGTCRELLNRDQNAMQALPGGNIIFSLQRLPELDVMKGLLPEFTLFGKDTEIPGLLSKYVPEDISPTNPIKTSHFNIMYLKNVEIEMNCNLIESEVIKKGYQYQTEKYGKTYGNIIVEKRILSCYIHNTYKNLNITGKETVLNQKGNYLYFNDAIAIENYFVNEMGFCGLICELSYVLTIPLMNGNQSESVPFPVAMAVIIPPGNISLKNIFETNIMISGPGKNFSGEEMIELSNIKNCNIKISYILSASKEVPEETYQDKQLEQINSKIIYLKESIMKEKEKDKVNLYQSQMEELEKEYLKKSQNYQLMYNRQSHPELKTSTKYEEMLDKQNQPFLIDQQNQKEQTNIEGDEKKSQSPLDDKNQTTPNQMDNAYYTDLNMYNNYKQFKDREQKESDKYFLKSNEFQWRTEPNINKGVQYQMDLSKNLTPSEQAELISKGVLSFDKGIDNISLMEHTFENEVTRRKHFGDKFTFNFVAFKPLEGISTFDNIPESVTFRFSFWDFNSFCTVPAKICRPASNLPSSAPLRIEKLQANRFGRSEEKEMIVAITFDPSIDDYIEYRTFINYLHLRSMFVIISDYDRQIHYGFIKIPLRILLKQGENTKFENVNFDIYDLQTFMLKGQIQMIIKSDEIKTYREFNTDNVVSSKFRELYTHNSLGNFKKKKVVSVKPLNINSWTIKEKEQLAKNLYEHKRKKELEELTQQYNQKQEIEKIPPSKQINKFTLSQEAEKKVRVMRYFATQNQNQNNKKQDKNQKIQKQQNIIIPNSLIEKELYKYEAQSEFYDTINYAARVKEMNKESIIQKTINENNRNVMTIALIQGQPHYFNYIISNESNRDELYHIIIGSEKEKNQTIDSTVSIITDAEEYERITRLHHLKIPNDYHCIASNYKLIIKPYENIPLVVKLLSYTNKNSTYTIWVYNQSYEIIHYMTINIPKVFTVIDHVFTYHIPMSKFVNIQFTNPFKYNENKTKIILQNMISFDTSINVKLDPFTNDFYFKFKTSKNENDVYENYIFLYQDDYHDTLFYTFKFEIYTRDTIEISSKFGVRSKHSLSLFPISTPKIVQFYSSNPEVLFFTENFSQPINIVPQLRYEVEFVLFPKKEKLFEILVSCVDYATKELVKIWLVRSLPSKPDVIGIFRVQSRVNSIINVSFDYVNPINEWAVLRFESSDKKVLEIKQETMEFNAEEKKVIECKVNNQNKEGKVNVYIFITDSEELFNQAILVELTYMKQGFK